MSDTYPSNGEHTDGYWYISGGLLADTLQGKAGATDVPSVAQATPSITVSSSGLVTASATQEEGLVAAGTKSSTKQLDTQAAQTIIPGTEDQVINPGVYVTGSQTIKGDENLIADNIAKDVSIFGVTGTYESELDSVVPMELGGTGAEDGAEGLANLFAAGPTVLSAEQYGDELPPAGTPGRIFFKRVAE